MNGDSLSKLLALLATALVAIAVSLLLTRSERRPPLPPALCEGYPPRDFPRRDLVESGPLASLCQSQSELLSWYRLLPPSSDARAGLLVFLQELRALMDGAYQLAQLQTAPDAARRLAQLANGAREAAREMVERTQQGQSGSSGLLASEIEFRLDVLRALARELDDVAPRAGS
jgi:hypothetical protein